MIGPLPPSAAVALHAREAAASIQAVLEAPPRPAAPPTVASLILRGPRLEVATPSGFYTLAAPALEVSGPLLPLSGLALIVAAAVAMLARR
jgi:hypothetical protein